MISQNDLTGGLSLPAFGLNEALRKWVAVEGSDGFVPAYKIASMADVTSLIIELVDSEIWTAISHNGKHYGYQITHESTADPSDDHLVASDDEPEIRVSDLAQSLVEDELAHDDEDQPKEPRRASRRGTPERCQQFRKEITDEDIEEGFTQFRIIFYGTKDSGRNYDAFKRAVKDVRSIEKILNAADAYTGFESAHRFLADELYLDTEVFRREL
jgi:hypothetical protein